MRRWVVTGAGGMLGQEVVAQLRVAGADVTALTRGQLDVTDTDAVSAAVRGHDIVVNCAAYTRVDAAEDHEESAFSVNAAGAWNIATACTASGAELVHLSTDYVFSGDASLPYAEDALLSPRTAYGRSKAAGEWAVRAGCPRAWIVRTAWLYGAGGPNFVSTIMRLAREREELRVVNDQLGQPTWARDVAVAVIRLINSAAPHGTWHATSQGQTSWHGFAEAILAGLGLDPNRVTPITTAEFSSAATRPAYSVLGHDQWSLHNLPLLPAWETSLAQALPDLVQRAAG